MLQASSWGMKSPQDLPELRTRYHNGEINMAFDKARIIWLARVGQGIGWLPEEQSWQWCQAAAHSLRQHYSDWSLFAQDISQGRTAWYDGQVPDTERVREQESLRFASAQVLPQIPFR